MGSVVSLFCYTTTRRTTPARSTHLDKLASASASKFDHKKNMKRFSREGTHRLQTKYIKCTNQKEGNSPTTGTVDNTHLDVDHVAGTSIGHESLAVPIQCHSAISNIDDEPDANTTSDHTADCDVDCKSSAKSFSNLRPSCHGDAKCADSSISKPNRNCNVGDTSISASISNHNTDYSIVNNYCAVDSSSNNNPHGPMDDKMICEHLHINDLPSSILIQVLRNLSLHDLLKTASVVCKRWYELCVDPDLWREINFKKQIKVDDTVLDRFTNYNSSVTFLDLTDVRLVTSVGLTNTLARCTSLRKLNLVRCIHIADAALVRIGQHCHKLVEAKLDCCKLSDLSLCKLASGCPMLEKLWLNQCGGISDEGVIAVTKGCPKLKLLTVEQCRQISDAVLEPLAAGCPNIESLGFMSNNLTPDGVKHLGKCKRLKILELTQMCGVNDECIIHIVKHCPYLRTLNVSLCTGISDKAVMYIAKHGVSLQSLYMVACKLTNEALFSLAKHRSTLVKLDVGWCEAITDQGAEAVSEGCTNLTYLGLMRCDQVTKETSERLVQTYPHVNYSTMWLECERLLTRARLAGFVVA